MDLLNYAWRYLSMKRNTYTLKVVDVIVCTAANVLNVNIKIFQEQEGFFKILAIEPTRTLSPVTCNNIHAICKGFQTPLRP